MSVLCVLILFINAIIEIHLIVGVFCFVIVHLGTAISIPIGISPIWTGLILVYGISITLIIIIGLIHHHEGFSFSFSFGFGLVRKVNVL